MEFIWSLPYLAVILWLIPQLPFFRNIEISTAGIRLILFLKSIMGIALILVYSMYYNPESADLFNYFQDGKILFSSLKVNYTDYLRMITGIGDNAPHLMHYYDQMNFWLKDFNYNLFNDNRTVIRFNAIVMLFSMENIYVHAYIMNILSVTGLLGIYTFIRKVLYIPQGIALLVTIIPPSLLFWGSGLLKEGILLFALGLFLNGVSILLTKNNCIKACIIIIISIAIFSISKFYVLMALIPGTISLWLSKHYKRSTVIFTSIHVILYLSIFILPHINGLPDIPQIIAQKQNDFIRYVHSLNEVGSFIESPFLKPDFFTFTFQAFRGAAITLFRPHIFEVYNAATIPAAIENTLTIILLLMVIMTKHQKTPLKTILFCISFTFILFALAGMTTPVLGALVRYKIPAQPFLYAALLVHIDWKIPQKYIEFLWPGFTKHGTRLQKFLFTK